MPHFTSEVVKVANELSIRDIFEFTDKMNPEEKLDYGILVKRLGLSQTQLVEAASFTKCPDISEEIKVSRESSRKKTSHFSERPDFSIVAASPALRNIKRYGSTLRKTNGDG
ncbi:hypothetical protein CONLIGDRAFT_694128 [Coniochaeta ligniaria NRRL 30616]|uniref:Uncharacterized protein n=1 Tax=Coniochaeta ligniaria NRRL 30616 TaxID=1408157 RepID=A0A1J7I721_9PEZI|nr:hypothetical protein CONLIGDRAFT_694128 [Coniochaeta ligniaria NRRL 30616]